MSKITCNFLAIFMLFINLSAQEPSDKLKECIHESQCMHFIEGCCEDDAKIIAIPRKIFTDRRKQRSSLCHEKWSTRKVWNKEQKKMALPEGQKECVHSKALDKMLNISAKCLDGVCVANPLTETKK